MNKCIICDKDTAILTDDKGNINRIIDDANNTFAVCAMCIRKWIFGLLSASADANRQRRLVVKEGMTKLKYADIDLNYFR